MLKVEGICASYKEIEVLRDISLEIRRGEVVCLVGANGAGKSTLLRVLSGVLHPTRGKLFFEDTDISHKDPYDVVRLGISHVPEGRQIFFSLTVRQNLLLGTYARRAKKDELAGLLSFVTNMFPVLAKKMTARAGSMSGGEQQMLAIARGLMARPRLLLLDEPSLGLGPIVVQNIINVIPHLCSKGISILLVEQNVVSALQIADRAYLMETGRIVKNGKAGNLLGDDEVRRRYLGR